MMVLRGRMPGSDVAVSIISAKLTRYSTAPPSATRMCRLGHTHTQKVTEMARVSSAANDVTPMSGPNIHLQRCTWHW